MFKSLDQDGKILLMFKNYQEKAKIWPFISALEKGNHLKNFIRSKISIENYSRAKNFETLGRGVRTFIDITSFIIALLLVILQFGVIDYYFISWKGDTYWYGWIGPGKIIAPILLPQFFNFIVIWICSRKKTNPFKTF